VKKFGAYFFICLWKKVKCLPCQSTDAVTSESPSCHPLPLRTVALSTSLMQLPDHFFVQFILNLEDKTEITARKRLRHDVPLISILPEFCNKNPAFEIRVFSKRISFFTILPT
jgi:hypothetical protein